jgi:rubrerythrin
MKIKGSKTEKGLMAGFAGESQARNRYTFFASQAKKENFIQIAAVFEETANQEKEHAKRMFRFLQGGEVEIKAAFPAGVIGSTVENLKAAAAGEEHEWTDLYPDFAKVAREEGFEEVARMFESVSVAEKQHGKRFRQLARNIEQVRVFKKEKPVRWRCLNCGYVHTGTRAPEQCPACLHPQAYFEILAENW